MRLIDSHCHLQADRFDDDVDAVIAAAQEAGVERILVPGWNAWSSAAALELAGRVPWLDAAVGVHPHDAAKVSEEEWEVIASSARDARVVAIGETGLDYDRVFSPIQAQLTNLRRNVELAVALRKPVILHCRSRAGEREAQDALLREVAAFGDRVRPVIHSFSGPIDYAEAMLELGAVISISGLAFRRGEEATAEVVRLVPADRLLVETDSPFLSPPGGPRGRNTPEWVRVTAGWAAELRGADRDAFGNELVGTYDRVFGAAAVANDGRFEIVDSSPRFIDVDFEGRRARISGDASMTGEKPDWVVHGAGIQRWSDGQPMSEPDRILVLRLLQAEGARRGWDLEIQGLDW